MHRRVEHDVLVHKENSSLDQIEEVYQFKSKRWNQMNQNNSAHKIQEQRNKNQANSGKNLDNNVKTFNCNKCGKSHDVN